MSRIVAIGNQDFESIRANNFFYIDKTGFIQEWWDNGDTVTLITRPRRFGKTLTMSMVEQFFSVFYAGRSDLFMSLEIWESEKHRCLQGAYPVINLSFANIKETNYSTVRKKICQILADLYTQFLFLLESKTMAETDRKFFRSVTADMDDAVATMALHYLCNYLYQYYGKKVIVLLDEYDTPMQEAYVHGYWEELSAFTRSLFNSTFKTNPCLERAIMTGITRVSKESIFSDLNNLEVVTTTSGKYADSFGFTEQEVMAALGEYGLSAKMAEVKSWYDGFCFGDCREIYNPWSIINYLDKGIFQAYWANTSSNKMIGKLLQEGAADIKISMEDLLNGGILHTEIDEQVVFDQLNKDRSSIWSFLLANGYLRVNTVVFDEKTGRNYYELELTNKEVYLMFEKLIEGWFSKYTPDYNDFLKALLTADIDAMNIYMNEITLHVFSFFDTGKHPSGRTKPELFYHGFVLGLIVDLNGRYVISSNRESGFGRYDIMLEPFNRNEDAIIMEFKVHNPQKEASLTDTLAAAHKQIEEKKYETALIAKGFPIDKIKKYGFAFEGKTVLIG